MDILKSTYDTISVVQQHRDHKKMEDLTLKIFRTIKVLHEYIRYLTLFKYFNPEPANATITFYDQLLPFFAYIMYDTSDKNSADSSQ